MSVYFDLLRQWCDALIEHQVQRMGPDFDGAFLCPACKYEHGRCMDAVYPFMYLADRTGEEKYLRAAESVVAWHDRHMICDDGGVYNDPNSAWRGITVFAATALCEALEKHSSLLSDQTRAAWQNKLSRMSEWLFRSIDEHSPANINYVATNAAALALTGSCLHRPEYLTQAKHLAAYTLDRITENGLLYGEGKPREALTPRRCRPIDIGYNVEESIPSLIKYALAANDRPALDKLTEVLRRQLAFMLPDGAWDNSFGSRNNKWTYYGSRTSDGCQAGYALLADRDPAFAEAALRNTLLLRRPALRRRAVPPARRTGLHPPYLHPRKRPDLRPGRGHRALYAAYPTSLRRARPHRALPRGRYLEAGCGRPARHRHRLRP